MAPSLNQEDASSLGSFQETIVAVATPPGRGGVAVIRLSGLLAYPIAQQITHKVSLQPRTAHYCSFYNLDGELLDQGIVLYFQGPASFTGEEVVELQGHGAPVVLDQLLKACVFYGARLARPGEFSERAFLNDKIDLTQAEAIADLIHASSQTAAKMAIRSLQGDFSIQINSLIDQLVYLRLYVEAAIDFPEEEIDFLNDGNIAEMLITLQKDLQQTISHAYQGAILREGFTIVIAGRPNVGKSTLINRLSGRELAIVSNSAGTTRDVMREHLLLDDIPLTIVDTAGLRESTDPVEQEGIKRAWQQVNQADCVLFVSEVNVQDEEQLDKQLLLALPSATPVIHVFNKIDALGCPAKSENDTVYLSAKSGEGLVLLKTKIKQMMGYQPVEGQFIARRRHLQALEMAQQWINHGQQQLAQHRAGELLADDLRLAQHALGEITGQFTADDLLGKIFSSFCIGK